MSVIVRTPGGVIKLLCKGAVSGALFQLFSSNSHSPPFSLLRHQDSVIYERMAGSQDDPLAVETGRHMEHFAVDGLRTLCVAERELEKGYYRVSLCHRPPSGIVCLYLCSLCWQEWSERYQEASTSLTEREKKLDEVAEEIEKVSPRLS